MVVLEGGGVSYERGAPVAVRAAAARPLAAPGTSRTGVQGLLEIKDTHRPRDLQEGYAWEHRTTLGAVRVLTFE